MKKAKCDYCGEPLGEARVVVHAVQGDGPEGSFCGWSTCFTKAREAMQAERRIAEARRIHSDLETVCRE